MTNVSLKTKASNDLPAFVRDDYKTFVAFIDAYHTWLDQNQVDIKTILDIDTTLASFIAHFKSQIDYKRLSFPYIDDKVLLRHIKSIFLSKGTEESYKLLFRMMFNKDIILKYPDQYTIKASDGKWEQVTSIFVEVIGGDPRSVENNIALVWSPLHKRNIKVTIEKVNLRRTGGGVSRIALSNGGSGYVAPAITFAGGNGTGAAATAIVQSGVITQVNLISGGHSYNAGTCTFTGGGSGAKAYATLRNGIIIGVTITAGGSGYTNPTINFTGGGAGASATVSTTNGVITSINLTNPGTNYTSPPTMTITGTHTTAASVGSVQMYTMPDIYEFNIDRHFYGSIDIGDEINFGNFSGKILPTINSFNIVNGGKNFRLGQTFKIDTMFGTGAVVKVTKLNANKGVEEIKFIRFGWGYVSDFESTSVIPPNISQSAPIEGFSNPAANDYQGTFVDYSYVKPSGGWIVADTYTGTLTYDYLWQASTYYALNKIIKAGQNFYKVTTAGTTNGTLPTHSNGTTTYGSCGLLFMDNSYLYSIDYAGDLKREFYSNNEYNGDPTNGAIIHFKLGSICRYPGRFVNSDGMPSDVIKIQDSFLYQKYSYIIQADEKLEKYADTVKSLLHPAGTALFGEYAMHNELSVKIKLTALFSVASVRHADAASFIDQQPIFEKLHEISAASAALRGTMPEFATPLELYIYWLDKVINDILDYATPGDQITYDAGFTYVTTKAYSFFGAKSDVLTTPTDFSVFTDIDNNTLIDAGGVRINTPADATNPTFAEINYYDLLQTRADTLANQTDYNEYILDKAVVDPLDFASAGDLILTGISNVFDIYQSQLDTIIVSETSLAFSDIQLAGPFIDTTDPLGMLETLILEGAFGILFADSINNTTDVSAFDMLTDFTEAQSLIDGGEIITNQYVDSTYVVSGYVNPIIIF